MHFCYAAKPALVTTSVKQGGRRGRDHMVVGFTTTCTISAYRLAWFMVFNATFNNISVLS
jgi:hypothetical protein